MAYNIKSVQFTSARDVQINITSTISDIIYIIQKPASYEMYWPGITSSYSRPINNGAFSRGTGRFNIIAQESPDGIIQIQYPTDVDVICLYLENAEGVDETIHEYSYWLSRGFDTKDPADLVQANNAFDTFSPGLPMFYRPQSTPLSTPTGLNATNITSNSARVSWTAVENASGYKVEYRQAAGGGQTFPWVEAQN